MLNQTSNQGYVFLLGSLLVLALLLLPRSPLCTPLLIQDPWLGSRHVALCALFVKPVQRQLVVIREAAGHLGFDFLCRLFKVCLQVEIGFSVCSIVRRTTNAQSHGRRYRVCAAIKIAYDGFSSIHQLELRQPRRDYVRIFGREYLERHAVGTAGDGDL